MLERNTGSWTSSIYAYGDYGPKTRQGCHFVCNLSFRTTKRFSHWKVLHVYVLRNGLEGCNTICNAMIDMYMNCGQQKMACRVFDNMSNRTVVSWNSLISGFIRTGHVKSAWKCSSKFGEAIELLRVMQTEGIKGDRVTMVEAASACGYLGALDLAKWIHAYIEKKMKLTVTCGSIQL
ncbi:putative pentatricopeptide [Rosa chinensis]|uniref:Putative pentatricopeptide n=1 Tax=Rosa chinensis TaxID=74649 RepID=A0A2P6QPW7_ROSCH|nr:putative pentatricopeptide [Rosa chinensis]